MTDVQKHKNRSAPSASLDEAGLPPPPIRILLADRFNLVRQGVAALLRQSRPNLDLYEVATLAQAMAEFESHPPDVALIDLDILTGRVALLSDLNRLAPGCAIVVLTSGDAAFAGQALQAGAAGYLGKDCEFQDLIRAIDRAAAGDMVVMAGPVSTYIGDPADSEASGPEAGLTERERQVLHLVVQGHTNPEIARTLCITEHTVKGHLTRILGKLMLDNRVQLTAYATQNGLARMVRDPVELPSAITSR